MLPLLGIIIGLIVGLFMDFDIPQAYSPYVAVLILAALDSLVGALSASLQKKFNTLLFVTGLLGNGLIAVVLSALGDRLNIDLNLAAIFAFGVRIINNFSQIRRFWLHQISERRRLSRQMRDVVDTSSTEESFIDNGENELGDIPLPSEDNVMGDRVRSRKEVLEHEIAERLLELDEIRQEQKNSEPLPDDNTESK